MVVMCRCIVLLLGLLTFVSGQSPPDHGTRCDVAILRLEKMVADLTLRVYDLETQRQADVMDISNVRRDTEETKNQNRRLKNELDRMATAVYGRQPPFTDRRVDSHRLNSGSNNNSQQLNPDSNLNSQQPNPDSNLNSQQPNPDSNLNSQQPNPGSYINSQPSSFDTKPRENKIVKKTTMNVGDTSRNRNENRIRRDTWYRPTGLASHLTNRVVSGGTVAFFATVDHTLSDVAKEQIIQYQTVVTNNGDHYNPQSGVFTCGTDGTYVFSWTVYASGTSWINTELVKNGHAFAYNRAGDAQYHEASSTTAVINLSPGDMVWTRVKDRSTGVDILANVSMFCGFKI